MKAVHIEKCDRDGDGIYTRTEMLCVASIYQAMYIVRLTGRFPACGRPARLLGSPP